MNNLSLDINKYTANELYDIFSIDEKSRNKDGFMKNINAYKNSIITNNSLSIKDKDNISEFLSKVLTKLINNLNIDDNTSDNTNDNYLSFSQEKNNLVSNGYLQHPIIANQNELAGKNANTYDGDIAGTPNFSPGYINPINIKSIRRSINIDSRFRDNYLNSKSTDYIIDLPQTFKKVVKMKLTAFEIPTTLHYINKSNRNNFFHYYSSGSEEDLSNVILDNGNYVSIFDKLNFNNNHIENKINQQLHNYSSDISYSIDIISGKSLFTSTQSFSLNFNRDICGNTDLQTPLIIKLGWLLGFRLGEYKSVHKDGKYEIISEGICLPNGPQYLFLAINDFTNAANNHFIAAFNSSVLSPHILARFNYQDLLRESGIYSYSVSINMDLEDENRVRSYFGPVNINRLHIQILDEYGRAIDLNNMDWSLTLALDVLYD